ncbi:MAG: hypothetical protein IJA34_00370 [Lachnospiraceae bacterium]|nr:hypothetical protein [Lachnospiraceae bacterium]
MLKYIEYKKFIGKLNYICKTYGVPKLIVEKIKKAISDSFATDVVEVVHGEWLPTNYNVRNMKCDIIGTVLPQWMCSRCGREEREKEPYCNCGAKMDGENNE